MDPREDEKRAAAHAAAELVQEGDRVGLGTGSTVAHFLVALSGRHLSLICVATSPATEEAARVLGLSVHPFDVLDRLDVAVDGADQVSPDHWVVKGRGGAHTREKVVARAADRFVVIVSSDKLVDAIGPPVPLEVLRFGLAATLRRVADLGPVEPREGPPTPDGNVMADYLGPVDDPAALADAFESLPGVVDHGLFAPSLVTDVITGLPNGNVRRVERGP